MREWLNSPGSGYDPVEERNNVKDEDADYSLQDRLLILIIVLLINTWLLLLPFFRTNFMFN
jgi:hypothetical protein